MSDSKARKQVYRKDDSNAYCTRCQRYLFLTAYDVEICPGCGKELSVIGPIPAIGNAPGKKTSDQG